MQSKLTVIPASTTIHTVQLSSELDGINGYDRAIGNRPQIMANTDSDAIKVWLSRYLDTKPTFDSYRKEAERLLLWSVLELGKPLSSLSHEDFMVYQRFLGDPQPVER